MARYSVFVLKLMLNTNETTYCWQYSKLAMFSVNHKQFYVILFIWKLAVV